MKYEYRCLEHPDQKKVITLPMSADKGWTHGLCPICGSPLELELGLGDDHRSRFRLTYGKMTGVYDYDYGKKATWDCTAPGKMDYLKKEGIIKDPFDSVPERTNMDVEI